MKSKVLVLSVCHYMKTKEFYFYYKRFIWHYMKQKNFI